MIVRLYATVSKVNKNAYVQGWIPNQNLTGTPSPPLPFPSLPSPPLRSRPLNPARGSAGSAVSSPSGVWGEAPADKRFGAYLGQKEQLWWQQFYGFS